MWTQTAFQGDEINVSAPVLLYNYVVVADNNGNIYWLSQQDGKFMHYISLGTQFVGNALIVEGNQIFALSSDATLYSIDIL